MKSNYKMKYIELPLSVFAVQYPAEYMHIVSNNYLPVDAVFDSRYIVRLRFSGSGGFSFEVGFANDSWYIN